MAFLDIKFPVEISYGSKGGPEFNTTVLELASGFEKRNINWSKVRSKYDAQQGIKIADQMTQLLDFFYVAQGKAHSWRYKDWLDFTISAQNIGTGDGTTHVFQLKKLYQFSSYAYLRNITKPVVGTLTGMTVGGVAKTETTHFTVNYTTGKITFITAPAAAAAIVLAYVEFDTHCRFDTDHMDVTQEFWQTSSWPSIPLVEIKDPD